MKRLTIAFIGLLILAACATINYFRPKYHDVDKQIQPIYNEYIELSILKHITFKHKVNVGFGKLDEPTVGMCVYTSTFREITIDPDWWKYATETSRTALIFHELTHCYCGRSHDYGGMTPYPEAKDIDSNFAAQRSEFWDDACPTSIMYPKVVFDYCMRLHYNEYIEEMFDRCEPW
ncbi:MAG: putative metallopeptidase [Candidatus Methanoperedens sp.]|nr:putative metallopeptidase [Candidatus Methanoperedens sp.]